MSVEIMRVLFDSKGVIISSKTNDFHRLSSSPRENYQPTNYAEKSNEIHKTEANATNHMSINLKNNLSSISSDSVHQIIASSHQMSSTVIYKPMQSVIQSTNPNANANASGNISTPISVPIESRIDSIPSRSNPAANEEKYTSDSSSNQYYMLRSTADNRLSNNQPPVYRERSIEETEAAHDLLSLSQSLPPLPAPCVVTILHPVTNYNVNSPDVQEITPNRSNEYITYTSGRTNHAQLDRTEMSARNKKSVSTQFDADMLPDDSSSSGKWKFNGFKSHQCTHTTVWHKIDDRKSVVFT